MSQGIFAPRDLAFDEVERIANAFARLGFVIADRDVERLLEPERKFYQIERVSAEIPCEESLVFHLVDTDGEMICDDDSSLLGTHSLLPSF